MRLISSPVFNAVERMNCYAYHLSFLQKNRLESILEHFKQKLSILKKKRENSTRDLSINLVRLVELVYIRYISINVYTKIAKKTFAYTVKSWFAEKLRMLPNCAFLLPNCAFSATYLCIFLKNGYLIVHFPIKMATCLCIFKKYLKLSKARLMHNSSHNMVLL